MSKFVACVTCGKEANAVFAERNSGNCLKCVRSVAAPRVPQYVDYTSVMNEIGAMKRSERSSFVDCKLCGCQVNKTFAAAHDGMCAKCAGPTQPGRKRAEVHVCVICNKNQVYNLKNGPVCIPCRKSEGASEASAPTQAQASKVEAPIRKGSSSPFKISFRGETGICFVCEDHDSVEQPLVYNEELNHPVCKCCMASFLEDRGMKFTDALDLAIKAVSEASGLDLSTTDENHEHRAQDIVIPASEVVTRESLGAVESDALALADHSQESDATGDYVTGTCVQCKRSGVEVDAFWSVCIICE